MSKRTNDVMVRLSEEELARLDELRGPRKRAEYLRGLLTGPPPEGEPTHRESVQILYGLAKDGKVGAAVALERALRGDSTEEAAGELARLLRDE